MELSECILIDWKVVDEASGTLVYPREQVSVIEGTHATMCKFRGPDDPGYRQVTGFLSSCTRNIAHIDLTPGKCKTSDPKLMIS